MGEAQQDVIVIAVPFPAQGHLNQLLHFSLHLSSHSIPVHFCGSSSHNRQAKSRIQGWSETALQNIHFHDLPIPPFPNPHPDPNERFPSHLVPSFKSAMQMRTPLSSLLSSLSPTARRLVVLHDPFMSFAAHDAAALPNAETYQFQCIPAFAELAISRSADKKSKNASQAAVDVISATFDGCFTRDFWELVCENFFDTPKETGVVVNTCRAIEGEFVDLLADRDKKVFAVGPINPIPIKKDDVTNPEKRRHEVLEWLDAHPAGSVVYVSFGSVSTLSDRQIEQLALGLQKSGQRFVWVLRDADRGDVFDGEVKQRELPLDFEKAVEGVGMVIRGWAPQLEILAHVATGAFMSHCGWNSTMESLSMGVPMITWPFHCDQPRNALAVTEYLKAGVAGREWGRNEEVITAEEIEGSVRKVMEGEEGKEVRKKAEALRDAIRAAIAEGGSSWEDLEAFVDHVRR